MKYFVFLYDSYYPNGGIHDLWGIFEDVKSLLDSLEKKGPSFDNGEIAELGGDGLVLVGGVNYGKDREGSVDLTIYSVTWLDGSIHEKRIIKDYRYTVELPPGYYARYTDGTQEELKKIPTGQIIVTAFSVISSNDPF